MTIQSLFSYSLAPVSRNFSLCPECNTPIRKQNTLIELPSYLMLALPRTYFSRKEGTLIKDCSFVEVSPQLCLQGAQSEPQVYYLYAVVVHVGSTPDSGHYVAYCRHSDDSENSSCWNQGNSWTLCNDEIVSVVSWSDMLLGFGNSIESPYLAVYHKAEHEAGISLLPSYYRHLPSVESFDPSFVKEVGV